jgi:hypothetical protein
VAGARLLVAIPFDLIWSIPTTTFVVNHTFLPATKKSQSHLSDLVNSHGANIICRGIRQVI